MDDILTCKIVVVGPYSAGKSSILSRFVTGEFNPYISTTLGTDFSTVTLKVEDPYEEESYNEQSLSSPRPNSLWEISPSAYPRSKNDCDNAIAVSSSAAVAGRRQSIKKKNKNLKLNIWDTAGQDKFAALSETYYRGAIGALLVYDTTDADAFTKITQFVYKLREVADEEVVVILVGNKMDLVEKRKVPKDMAKEFIQQNGNYFSEHFETSALTGEKIEDVFHFAAQACYNVLRFRQKRDELNFKQNNSKPQSLAVLSHNLHHGQKRSSKYGGCC